MTIGRELDPATQPLGYIIEKRLCGQRIPPAK
jgi:hypothetical protein